MEDNTAILDLNKIFKFLKRFPDTQTIIVNGGDPLMMKPNYYWKIIEYLDKANMSGFQDRYPNSLSGGQKARVACLRAILSEPDALLLDEPFSSLDPDQRNSFRLFIIKQVQDRNIPCLLVTHDESDKAISDYKPLDLNMFHP